MLTLLITIPIIGSIILIPINNSKVSNIKRISLITSIIVFILSIIIWNEFNSNILNYQFTSNYTYFKLGIDGLSLYFVLLTTFTFPLCILASWKNVKFNIKYYMILLLVLESLLITVFVVIDLFLFYIFFESVLIPLFILIGIWGASENRIRAALLLFLYTLLGSLFMLLSFITLFYHTGTTDFQILNLTDIDYKLQLWIWLGIFVSLAIKTPLLPFHIWLSRAHVEAPVAVSMILAGLILKLATYGYLRILIPILPEATSYFAPLIQTIALITLLYSSLTTLRQIDFKVLVAYSSVAHMAVVVIGLFSNNIQGIEGAIILSLAHGLVSPALFFCVGGILYDRFHTRIIRYYRGLTLYMPVFSTLFFIFILANMSTPFTMNWIGEFMCLISSVQHNLFIGIGISLGIVLSAAYSIWLYVRLCNGSWSPYLGYTTDLSRREFYVLFSFCFIMILFGLYPNIILNDLHLVVSTLLYQ